MSDRKCSACNDQGMPDPHCFRCGRTAIRTFDPPDSVVLKTIELRTSAEAVLFADYGLIVPSQYGDKPKTLNLRGGYVSDGIWPMDEYRKAAGELASYQIVRITKIEVEVLELASTEDAESPVAASIDSDLQTGRPR